MVLTDQEVSGSLRPRRQPHRKGVRRLRRGLVWGLLLTMLLGARAWAVEPLRIPSSSMAPTLRPGEHVLAEKVTGHFGRWKRGDLVVFTSPDDGGLALKRLVGMAGDRVEIRDGRLFVNDSRVREPYVDHARVDSVYYGPVTVPDGQVLVLGDNRGESEDSRQFGTVRLDAVEGRVIAVLWPPADTRLLTRGDRER